MIMPTPGYRSSQSVVSKAKSILAVLGYFLMALFLTVTALVCFGLWISLNEEVEAFVPGLTRPVAVTRDPFGIPTITAESSLDGFRALGHVTARDRLFQMDILRRSGAGRLAEIFGEAALPVDIEQRVLGFEQVAREVAARLPQNQHAALEAYAEGVNGVIDSLLVVPFEFLLLNYRPERWRVEDSLLIVLSMFQKQSHSEDEERMLTVMKAALPDDVYRFLTPLTDPHTRAVLGEVEDQEESHPIPVQALISLINQYDVSLESVNLLRFRPPPAASNAWAVAGSKTADGRAILANDMHTGISVPNIWYRCRIKWNEGDVAGVVLPGTPLIVAGSSRHLAWGVTALMADVLDLVQLHPHPDHADQYLTPSGWQVFGNRRETIVVKHDQAHTVDVRTTIWGPVSPKSLLGQPVALRWSVLDPEAINLQLIDLYTAPDLNAGIPIVNATGGPPLNVILAEKSGRIAWTTMGRLPQRQGFDGMISQSGADGLASWLGYVPPEMHPRVVDPAAGIVINANNRSVQQSYPFVVGHAYSNGYRAQRIAERLHALPLVSEKSMFALQLDTRAGMYGFYRDIALEALSEARLGRRPELIPLREHILLWDGYANPDSTGLALLVEFRVALARTLLKPFLYHCLQFDPAFVYDWGHLDVPLQALLKEKNPELLSSQVRSGHADWDAFIVSILEQVAERLIEEHQALALRELTWSKVNVSDYMHILSRGLPGMQFLLDMPRTAVPGCDFCVRVDAEAMGATERLVVSPGHWDDGILQIPGGQSGHPLSKNYRDQYTFWLHGQPIHFVSDITTSRLQLMPAFDHTSH